MTNYLLQSFRLTSPVAAHHRQMRVQVAASSHQYHHHSRDDLTVISAVQGNHRSRRGECFGDYCHPAGPVLFIFLAITGAMVYGWQIVETGTRLDAAASTAL